MLGLSMGTSGKGGGVTVPVAQTLYLLDATASSSSHGSLQNGGTAPSVATTATGWGMDATVANKFSEQVYASSQGVGTFGTTALPSGAPSTTDCWRTQNKMTGTFAAGTWTFALAVKNTSGANPAGNPRIRVWFSADPTGQTSPTEITAGAVTFTASGFGIGGTNHYANTASLGAATLNGAYLFLQVAWNETGAPGAASTIAIVQDGTNSVITTPAFG